jgi:hypothetical protein
VSEGEPPERSGGEAVESLSEVKQKDIRPVAELPPEETEAIYGEALKDLVLMKRRYGKWMLWIMGAQLLIANGVFITYAWAGWNWAVPGEVVQVWLGATFVQVVGVVLVITKSLFPSGGDLPK